MYFMTYCYWRSHTTILTISSVVLFRVGGDYNENKFGVLDLHMSGMLNDGREREQKQKEGETDTPTEKEKERLYQTISKF